MRRKNYFNKRHRGHITHRSHIDLYIWISIWSSSVIPAYLIFTNLILHCRKTFIYNWTFLFHWFLRWFWKVFLIYLHIHCHLLLWTCFSHCAFMTPWTQWLWTLTTEHWLVMQHTLIERVKRIYRENHLHYCHVVIN
jgi:hypothetical protein